MQRILLPVAHYQHPQAGECLPACAAMVLSYRGVAVNYARLVRLMGTISGFGTPSFRLIDAGKALGVNIKYGQGSLATLYQHLQQIAHPLRSFKQDNCPTGPKTFIMQLS